MNTIKKVKAQQRLGEDICLKKKYDKQYPGYINNSSKSFLILFLMGKGSTWVLHQK